MASGSGLLKRTGRGTGTRNEAHNMVESGKEPVEVDEPGKPWLAYNLVEVGILRRPFGLAYPNKRMSEKSLHK